MYKKKIALTCMAFATAGMLLTGCAKKGDTELRRSIYESLTKLPQKSYEMPHGDYIITAKKGGLADLDVTIKNKLTGDVLEMTDREIVYHYANTLFFIPFGAYFNGVDSVSYNGTKNGTEGMDERFDEALRKIKPSLELKIQQEVQKVKENTELK